MRTAGDVWVVAKYFLEELCGALWALAVGWRCWGA
jgi:hypothetical protein